MLCQAVGQEVWMLECLPVNLLKQKAIVFIQEYETGETAFPPRRLLDLCYAML